ncbi:MAG TPA: hypothetical protein VGX50_11785 [Longimicrobium sp.]|jgi:hypothetical protein|nr:hypothetical protein [Longimicrobium sp.]
MKNWEIADPDEELNRIVRQAFYRGPQRVTLDDDLQVVVLSAAEYARLIGEPLPVLTAESGTEPKSALSMFAEVRRMIDEAAGEEDLSWPWDWDCETREWVLPADDAVSV